MHHYDRHVNVYIYVLFCVRSAMFVTRDNFFNIDMDTNTSPMLWFSCTGSETHLVQCNKLPWRRYSGCSIDRAAGVSCVSNGEENFDVVSITSIFFLT